MQIGKRAESLIINFEGWDVPWSWPGSSSGITLPIGYDIGYEPFARDWKGLLDAGDFKRLLAVAGLKGGRAEAVAHTLRGIHVPHDAAIKVFESVTIPRYEELTASTFPFADRLPADAFGGLVSLVFNRGADLRDMPGRKPRPEMREIKAVLQASNGRITKQIINRLADLMADQAHYWPDNVRSDGDLHDRRLQEADLIRRSG